MAHEVESMFYYGDMPWHKLGTKVKEAPDSAAAIQLAGLNWTVERNPVYNSVGMEIEGYKSLVRSTDQRIFSIVSDKYKVIQPWEGFALVDNLLGLDAQFETAGSLRGGKRIWMMVRLAEEWKVAGDPITMFLSVTNSYDGISALQVVATPVRVVCANTLALSLQQAKRTWSTAHTGSIAGKLDEARNTLGLADRYAQGLDAQAQELMEKTFSLSDWPDIVREILPEGERENRKTTQMRQTIETALFAEDLQDFALTGWGAVNAVSWATSHTDRGNSRSQETPMAKFLDGDPLIKKTVDWFLNGGGEESDEEVLADLMD